MRAWLKEEPVNGSALSEWWARDSGEMKTFIDPNLLQRLRVGPLAPYLDAYLKHIEQEGFLPSSAPMQMYAIARFSKWLRDRQFDLHQAFLLARGILPEMSSSPWLCGRTRRSILWR